MTPAAASTGGNETASPWKRRADANVYVPKFCGHQRPHQKLNRWPLLGGVCMLEGSGRGI